MPAIERGLMFVRHVMAEIPTLTDASIMGTIGRGGRPESFTQAHFMFAEVDPEKHAVALLGFARGTVEAIKFDKTENIHVHCQSEDGQVFVFLLVERDWKAVREVIIQSGLRLVTKEME